MPPESASTNGHCPPQAPRIQRLPRRDPEKPPNRHIKAGHKLLSRDALDGRLGVSRRWDELVASIEADLGGTEHLSAVERRLVQAFAGINLALDNLNGQALLGRQINIGDLAQIASAMVRVASRLGVRRRPREPALGQYLERYEAEPANDEEATA